MSFLNLTNVTLVCFAIPGHYQASIKAIEYSIREINFFKSILFTDQLQKPINGIEQIKIPKFNNVYDWGEFVVFKLYKFIQSEFIILIHDDGFIVNPKAWNNNFLKYDYIGAPWPPIYRDKNNELVRVGNSVSLRSKKILELPSQLQLEWSLAADVKFHEDGFICLKHRKILMQNKILFAPFDIACNFSREKTFKENKNIKTFAFHKWQGNNRVYPCFNRFYQIQKKLTKLKKFFLSQ